MQCEASGISFQSIEKQTDSNSQIYSSSSIRDFISQGDIVNATTFLGYYWYIKGLVIKGQNKGTDMGFPTVNLRLNKSIKLAHGIYATNIYFNGHKYGAHHILVLDLHLMGMKNFLKLIYLTLMMIYMVNL